MTEDEDLYATRTKASQQRKETAMTFVDDLYPDRPRDIPPSRRVFLAKEVERHERKAAAARARLEALAGVPDRDPYEDGMVLVFQRTVDRRTFTYAAIRQNKRWWTTESRVGQPRTWVEFTNWLVDGGTVAVVEMTPASQISLAAWHALTKDPELIGPEKASGSLHEGTIYFQIRTCFNAGEDHGGHIWESSPDSRWWCPGRGPGIEVVRR